MPSVKITQAFLIDDQPHNAVIDWLGYFHNTDPTVLPPNCLTFPSVNCFIPNKDKIVPRLGKTLLGAAYTDGENWPVIGHKERFATMGGDVLEVRVTQTDSAILKDLIEVLYKNPLTGIPTWYPITYGTASPNVNVLPAGLHRYYMDDWFDSNLDPGLSLNVPRLVWVNGNAQVYSWIGAIAPIVNVSANFISVDFGLIAHGAVTGTYVLNETITGSISGATAHFASDASGVMKVVRISGTFIATDVITGGTSGATSTVTSFTPPAITWASLGFIDPSITGESGDLIINGLQYTGVSGWSTATLSFAPTTPTVNVGDIAFSQIRADDVDVAFDVCRNNKNYMFYGNWNSRQLFMSNNFGHSASQDITSAQAASNDLIVSGSYTGTGSHILRYQIDSVAGDPQEYVYDPDPASGTTVDNVLFSGDHIGVNLDVYRIVITTATVGSSLYQVFKNGSSVSVNNPINYDVPTLLLGATADGISITFVKINEATTPYKVNQSWTYMAGGEDTYSIFLDGVIVGSTHRPAVTPYTSQGVTLKVNSYTGHSLGDYWEVTLNQSVTEAWTNFYYTIPVRKPGEGYIYRLSSNFWTMEPQEEEMYVNTQYGYWDYVSTVLSSDLQSETVSLTPLKHASASKVIFPYMISHLDNDLIFVTENKTLDMIGRREFLELPQIGYLSQPVALDFLAASFEDGSMEYLDKKMFLTSPRDATMLVYDNQSGNKYWQPPQQIAENGILSIVENTLISHSNIRNQTYNLFTGTSGDASGNDMAAYTVRARTPYNSYGNRWGLKNSNKSFFEGYVKGAPPFIFTVYQGVHGCKGIFSHLVEPIVCVIPTKAPLGEGNLASHPFGSDIFDGDLSHFNEIYTKFNPILQYYFAALEVECTTTNHSYEWLLMGLNKVTSNTGNSALIPEEVISKT